MSCPRTLTVLEHEFVPVTDEPVSGTQGDASSEGAGITALEAQALLRLNETRRGFCQALAGGLKFAQYCGIVRLPTRVLEILPKIGMAEARADGELPRARAALLNMLHSARGMAITRVDTADQQAVRAPLLDVFVEAFLQCSLAQARRGLLSRYVPHADDLPVVRGRFQAHGHVRRNLGRPHLLHCEFDEFTADNAYNRAVRAALEACRSWMTRQATQRLWFEVHSRYANVASVPMTAAAVARLPRERMTRRYEPLLSWCEWLLSLASPALAAGGTQAPALLFDMNRLFEAHVSALEEAQAGPGRTVRRQGPAQALAACGNTELFSLKPDITVWRNPGDGTAERIEQVIDAKWKRVDPGAADFGVDASDLYQLLAYALRYGCGRLALAYPEPGPAYGAGPRRTFDVAAGVWPQALQVEVRTVPLWI